MTPEEFGVSSFAIEEMTIEELFRLLKDKLVCGRCSSSLCKYATSKGEACGCKEDECLEAVENRIKELQGQGNTPEKEEETAVELVKPIDLSYQSTIDFMKNRGYSRCYMCGSNLKEESPFD